MTLRTCPHEPEIKQMLALGHWPQAASDELRSHAEGCSRCGDLVLLSQAFRGARKVTMAQAQVPAAGVVWWRAQLRRRNAAVQRINRPIVAAQIFAFAAILSLVGIFVYVELQQSPHWKSWMGSFTHSSIFDWKALWSNGWIKPELGVAYLIPGLIFLALLSGAVVYLVSERE